MTVRRIAIGIGVLAVVLSLGATRASARSAQTPHLQLRPAQVAEHRAVVVVDTGTFVRNVCVRFTQDSLSGTEVLQRAGVNPGLRTFGGQGAAVCSLCGQGCPSDGSCLTCGGKDYWAYFRASSGSATFRYAAGGAGGARVRDGDVEGWKWGNGSAPPPYVSVEQICGPVPAIVPSTIAAAAGPAAPSGVTPTPATVPLAPTAPGAPDVVASNPAVAGTSVVAAPPVAEGAAAGAPSVTKASSGSPYVLAAVVGTVIGAVVGLVGWSIRRRVGTPSG